jgi:hypothetical protein
MDYRRVQTSLRLIRKRYGKLLADSHTVVLAQAEASVGASKELYDRSPEGARPPWGYTITGDQPLRFITSKSRRVPLQVDIACNVGWAEDDIPVTQGVKIRVWCEHRQTIFDRDRDAEQIEVALDDPNRPFPGRVVCKLHFDKHIFQGANLSEYHPVYHMQIGGLREDYELLWHPRNVDVPRLVHQPMELFLACQMVAANFFWKEYQEIRKRSEWHQELLMYQKALLRPYYLKCLDAVSSNKSLLDDLGTI